MEINKHIGFLIQENPELFNYIITENIPYEEIGQSCVLDIYESSPHWAVVRELVEKNKLLCLSHTFYTEKELAEAQWLTMRSVWRCGYPQPENGEGYEAITYSMEDFCQNCGTGLKQTADFRIKKSPKWGKRHFMMLNWVGDEIFVNDTARKLLSESDLSGFRFREVRDKKGLEVFDNISQVEILNVLPRGLLTHFRSIDQINKCQICEAIKYHSTGIGSLAFQREIFESAPDIVKTSELFGWEYWTQREIIVSQKFYQFILSNCLDNSLEFQPIELI